MKITIPALLFLALVMSGSVMSQPPKKKPAITKNDTLPEMNAPTKKKPAITKNDILSQMNGPIGEIKKQITELEKQLKSETDPETIKNIKEQIAMLRKQLDMMQGLNRSVSKMSDRVIEQASDQGNDFEVPKRDQKRINSIRKKSLTDEELPSYINGIHMQVEKTIPAEEKREASKIYEETKSKWKSAAAVSNAAAGCWIYGHWEKALYLEGKACLDNPKDPNNLNNYASYLTMVGAEHAALPILQYLDKKYPENSTIMNNIGQALFGLGDIGGAQKYLESTTSLYPSHSMANLTLASIYKSQGDIGKAISALKASMRKSYTSEKESKLKDLGYEIDEDDIEFPYKLDGEEDLFGIDSYFPIKNRYPLIPGSVNESALADKQWEAFYEACDSLTNEWRDKESEASEKGRAFAMKMIDPAFHQPVLNTHNNNPHNIAGRKLLLAAINKKSALSIEEVMHMQAVAFHDVATERLNALYKQHAEQIKQLGSNATCGQVEAIDNNFMQQARSIMDEGVAAMDKIYYQHKKQIRNYVRLLGYSTLNEFTPKKVFSTEVWKKNQWIYTYLANFTTLYRSLLNRPEMYYPCSKVAEVPKQRIVMPPLKIPGCPHKAIVKLPVGKIKERCNTMDIDESKLKFRKNNIQKGEIILTVGEIEILDDVGEIELTMGEPRLHTEGGEIELTMGEPREVTDAARIAELNGPQQGQSEDAGNSMSVEADNNGNVHVNTNEANESKANNNTVSTTVNSLFTQVAHALGFGQKISAQ